MAEDPGVVASVPTLGSDPGVSRRELAVARSLHSARARAEDRFQRFLDAALELMNEGEPGKDFTVQEVVERSGQSLRLFYQYFGGKHELLLALFEESVRSTTEVVRQRIAGRGDALDRLHGFVAVYYQMCRPAPRSRVAERPPIALVMVDFAQQLLTSHPTEAALAFAPLAALFDELLDDAVAAGSLRDGVRRGPVAGMVLQAIMFNDFATTIGGVSRRADPADLAEELWDLVLHGLGSTPAP